MAGLDQLVCFVDFFELVGGAGAVAFALGELDVGVVNMIVQPRFVDFSTLGLDLQFLAFNFFLS